MAHTFTNLGFETAGASAGLAAGWTCVFFATAEEFAAYDVAVPEAWEDFEEEWATNNEDGAFTLGTVVVASYDVVPAVGYEDFEDEWANTTHSWVLVSVLTAAYNTALDAYEAFESEWNDNEDGVFDWADVVTIATASYDLVVPESQEDFEEEWRSNEDDITEFSGGDVVTGTFDGQNFEDFEEVDLRMQTVEVVAAGADGDELIIYINGSPVVRQCTGVGDEDDERDLLVDLVNAAVLGAVASAGGSGQLVLRAAVSGDALSVKVEATGAVAKIALNTPPNKTLYWTQTGELA